MATQVQRRRGTTGEHSTFTGALSEVTVDTTKNTLVVHDGSTAGGFPLALEVSVTDHLSDTTDAHDASAISYDNSTSGLVATEVQSAIDEILSSGTLSYFTEGRDTSAPNDTVPVHSFTVSGAESNIDAALIPKGTGAILAQVPDGTTTGGNKRGGRSVDFQTARTAADQVASNSHSSILGGYSNKASGSYCCVVNGSNNIADLGWGFVGNGQNNYAGYAAFVGSGRDNTADGEVSVIPGGRYGHTRGIHGRYSYSSARFSVNGDAQEGRSVLILETTDATSSILTADGNATPTTTTVSVLPDDHAYAITARIIGRDTSTGDIYHVVAEGTATRGAGAATTALVGTPSYTTISQSAGASTWAVALVTNTTRGSAEIQVTGAATTTIHWVCKFETIEVG